MTVLTAFHDFKDIDSKKSISCRKSVILLITVQVVCSFLTGSNFNNLLNSFNRNCFLSHDNIQFAFDQIDLENQGADDDNDRNDKLANSTANRFTIRIDEIKSLWGTDVLCDYAAFVPICQGLFGTIWLALYVMSVKSAKTSRGYSQSWQMVIPTIIFYTFMSSVTGIYIGMILKSIHSFCDHVTEAMNLDLYDIKLECSHILELLSNRRRSVAVAKRIYNIQMITPWITLAVCLLIITLAVRRCVLIKDFRPIKVDVSTIEETLKLNVDRNMDNDELEQF